MSKTSYLLLIILCIIAICMLAAFLAPQTAKLPSFSNTLSPTPRVNQSTLTLAPAVQTVSSGQTSYVDIQIVSQGTAPDTIQLEIGYNPQAITPIALTPGKYFNDQIVLLNTINPRNARITFAITCRNKPSPCGSDATQSVGRLTFTVSQFVATGQTQIEILPKSLVTNTNTKQINLQMTDAKILFQGGIQQQASPGAVFLQ